MNVWIYWIYIRDFESLLGLHAWKILNLKVLILWGRSKWWKDEITEGAYRREIREEDKKMRNNQVYFIHCVLIQSNGSKRSLMVGDLSRSPNLDSAILVTHNSCKLVNIFNFVLLPHYNFCNVWLTKGLNWKRLLT